MDTVDITGIAKCGLTTKFLKTQLAPFLRDFQQIPINLSITYHALSLGSKKINDSIVAQCNNGELECELSKLQTCAKKYVSSKNSTAVLSAVICIQGQGNRDNALACLSAGKVAKQIEKCASSQEGEKLLIAEPFPGSESFTPPFISINGKRLMDANKHFKKVICELASIKNEKQCTNKY